MLKNFKKNNYSKFEQKKITSEQKTAVFSLQENSTKKLTKKNKIRNQKERKRDLNINLETTKHRK